MKKVTSNKLKLNKETLTNLQMGSLTGGATNGRRCKSALDACPSQRGCTVVNCHEMTVSATLSGC